MSNVDASINLTTSVFKRENGGVRTTLPRQVAGLLGWGAGTRLEWLLVGGSLVLRATDREGRGGNVTTIYALAGEQLIVTIPRAIAEMIDLKAKTEIEWRFVAGDVTIRRA